MFSRQRHEIVIPPHFTPDHPDSSQGTHLEKDPFNAQLQLDTRPVAVKKSLPVLEPELNQLYGYGRSEGDWRYFIDNFATGTVTTIANTLVTKAVVLTNQPFWRLSQWPAAVHLYLCIRKFSMAPQSAITTVGAIDVQFQDSVGGFTIPLGDFVSSSNINEDITSIIPVPITDPGNVNVGNLLVTLAGTTPTVSIYNWQMAFSAVYLLPTLEGYEVEPRKRVLRRWRNDQ